MIRFILSVIILTLLLTYAVAPLIKYFKRFVKAEGKRMDKAFTNKKEKVEVKDDI